MCTVVVRPLRICDFGDNSDLLWRNVVTGQEDQELRPSGLCSKGLCRLFEYLEKPMVILLVCLFACLSVYFRGGAGNTPPGWHHLARHHSTEHPGAGNKMGTLCIWASP